MSAEKNIAAGDIEGILSVVEKAVVKQNERLPDQDEPESYAEAFTGETINLMDDLLRRPLPWLGIAPQDKMQKLGEIQTRVDEISHSLISFTTAEEQEYRSTNDSA